MTEAECAPAWMNVSQAPSLRAMRSFFGAEVE